MGEVVRKFKPVPLRCSWEITLRCNLRCGHCGSSAGCSRRDELNTGEALQLCDDLAALGCRQATLLGGEPFLRLDWPALVERLRGHGVDVNLVSNGMLIDGPLARRLRGCGLRRIGLSLDGLEETHNAIRGNARAFSRWVRAIECLTAEGLEVCAITVAMERNLSELPALLEFMESRGVAVWQLQLPVPRGRCAEGALVLKPESVPAIMRFIARAKKTSRLPIVAGCNLGYYGDEEEAVRTLGGEGLGFWTGCYAGLLLVAIRSNGDVAGCLTMPPEHTEGNVRETPLADIWSRRGAFAYNRNPSRLQGGCASCEYGSICRGGCRTMAYYSQGTLFDDPFCSLRVWRERASAATRR